jgi:transitional endoplasmic reticulum ATPase
MLPRFLRSTHAIRPQELPPLIRLWLLRLLVPLGGHGEFVRQHGFSSDAVAEILGLGEWTDTGSREYDPRGVRIELRRLHQDAERRFRRAKASTCLRANVARLAELVGLSAADRRILEFVVLIQNEHLLEDATTWLGELSSLRMFHALSVLLDLPEEDIRTSLSAQGVLARSGLVSVDRTSLSTLRHKLELLSPAFADHIASVDADPVGLLRDMVEPVQAGHLQVSDFRHIQPWIALLQPYLERAIATDRRGVNIAIYGNPGTGKSELSRTLAAELHCELFEIASEDADGNPVSGELRLRAFRAAQNFFGQRRALLLFDEVEDVFNDGGGRLGRKSTAQTCKAWINRILEDNPVPTLWLSNSIECLDPAFIRRFDMVIELPVPPRKQREQILREACSDLLDEGTIARLAQSESLAPAVITRAAAVVGCIGDDLDATGAVSAMELLIGGTLTAQGHQPTCRNDPSGLPETYDPAFVQADADIGQLAAGLLRTRMGRLCLYGPPGTGKTAFARWLAERMGAPLVVKRASDILSAWVGEDEKNIAVAFRQAEREGAVLLIDEVDSFLQDRRGAVRSWEVTMVNEMLTQMEAFSGVFVASTNLMEGLDQAALRRFDLKVKFDFMRPEQAWELLCRHCRALSIPAPDLKLKSALAGLAELTPGDFAAVVRQHRFRPLASAADVVSALEAECAVKEGARSSIGFH